MTRPAALRFRSGEFVMIGLPNAEKPVFAPIRLQALPGTRNWNSSRSRSPGGPLTEHLQKSLPGDTVLISKKATGTLVNDALMPGKRLYMFSTGTGIAPFASLDPRPGNLREIRRGDPDPYLPAEVRNCDMARNWCATLKDDPLVGEFAQRLTYYPTTTREDLSVHGPDHRPDPSGKLFTDLGCASAQSGQTDRGDDLRFDGDAEGRPRIGGRGGTGGRLERGSRLLRRRTRLCWLSLFRERFFQPLQRLIDPIARGREIEAHEGFAAGPELRTRRNADAGALGDALHVVVERQPGSGEIDPSLDTSPPGS